jgi:hypothetical protein
MYKQPQLSPVYQREEERERESFQNVHLKLEVWVVFGSLEMFI